jgi:hypothetical protein
MAVGSYSALLLICLIAPMSASASTGLNYELGEISRNLRSIRSDLQRQHSTRSFRSFSNARWSTLDRLHALGIDAFLPLNEGKIRAGSESKPQCPSNASVTVGYCACDNGYKYNGLNKCVAKEFKLDMTMAERKKSFDDFIKRGGKCPDFPIPAEYTATKFVCEIVNPYR